MNAPSRGLNDVVTGFWGLVAPVYDLPFLQRWVYQPVQDEVMAVLRARGPRTVADIACGTGILATRIHDELHPEAVYGVDMSDGMLAQARERCAEVHWRKAPAEQLPFADAELDAVVSTTAFHFFDQPAAMAEFRRVLAPGGIAAVGTISPPQPAALRRVSASLANPAHSPAPAEMRALFTEAGFTVTDQHRPRRPLWTRGVFDLITVGTVS
jgi:ubiquinone/menaquinone biosynthesis C-methylase UbiE